MVGTGLLSASDIEVLAELPSRDALLAQFAGALSAPMQQLAGLIQALPRNLAYGLSALIEQRQAEGGSDAEATAEPAAEAAAAPAAEDPTAESGSDLAEAPEARAPEEEALATEGPATE